jgi:hypothetical protein
MNEKTAPMTINIKPEARSFWLRICIFNPYKYS